jgi:hypothetical protein
MDELTGSIRIPLTPRQAYFLDDMRAAGSETYHEALDAGARVEGSAGGTWVLIVPRAAFGALGTAVGMRADIADEGEYDIGQRSSILGLARKLANAGVTGAAPL